MMYRCHTCCGVFREPEERRVDDGPSEAFGVRLFTRSIIDVCPDCESADIEEFSCCAQKDCVDECAPGADYCAPHDALDQQNIREIAA